MSGPKSVNVVTLTSSLIQMRSESIKGIYLISKKNLLQILLKYFYDVERCNFQCLKNRNSKAYIPFIDGPSSKRFVAEIVHLSRVHLTPLHQPSSGGYDFYRIQHRLYILHTFLFT